MIAGLIDLALPVVAALMLARRLDGPSRWLVTLPIAGGLCLGLSSVVFWLLMLLPLQSRAVLIGADAVVWIVMMAALWQIPRVPRGDTAAVAAPTPSRLRTWCAAVTCLLVAGAGVARFVAMTATAPHGGWDAWAFWNSHARALFRGYPDVWRAATAAILHPDYPMLTPAAIARVWMDLGRDTMVAPIAMAALFSTAIVMVAAGSIARTHDAMRGWITAAAILAAPAFVTAAASQFADIPLTFFMLAALVSFDRAIASRRASWWLAAGGCAGFAAWTKNEGQVFLLLSLFAMGVCAWRARAAIGLRPLWMLCAGAVPGVLALAAFRWALPVPHELFAGLSLDRVDARLRSGYRWHAIGAALGRHIWLGGATVIGALPLTAVVAAACGFDRPVRAPVVAGAAILLGMLLAYALVYLFSPVQPRLAPRHVRRSRDRAAHAAGDLGADARHATLTPRSAARPRRVPPARPRSAKTGIIQRGAYVNADRAHDHTDDHDHDHAHDHDAGGGHAHGHAHAHDHDHAGHSHGVSADADRRYLTVALVLIVGFMAFEVVVGIVAHSLALISDAGHMLTDAGALVLSLIVIRLVQRPTGGRLTYGMRRAEVLSGQANGAVLLVLGVLVSYEAIWRLIHPPEVAGVLVTVVAARRRRRERGRGVGARESQSREPERRRQLPAHPHGPLRVHRHAHRRRGHHRHRLRSRRRDRVARRRRADDPLGLRAAAQGDPRAARGRAGGHGARGRRLGDGAREHVSEVHDLHLWELAPGHPVLTAHVLVAARLRTATRSAEASRRCCKAAFRDRAHHAAGRSRAARNC